MELFNDLPHGPVIYFAPIHQPQCSAKEQNGAENQTGIVHVLGIDGLVWGKCHEYNEDDRINHCSKVDR